MKKLMAVALVFFTLTCIFTACKKSDNIPPADIKVIDLNTTRPTEKATSVRQNKKIKVQIPSAFIESEAGGDIEKYAATFGYKIKEKTAALSGCRSSPRFLIGRIRIIPIRNKEYIKK